MMAEIIWEREGWTVSPQRWEEGIRVVAPFVDVKSSRATIVPFYKSVNSPHLPNSRLTIPINGLGLGNGINPSSV
jgi:hypothetical protein